MSGEDATILRRRFLDERRAICEQRMDTLFAPVYDDRWGSYINRTHGLEVEALITRLRVGATVLDAACGTGKYWPTLLQSGVQVVGVDQSQAMLDVATHKHPMVPVVRAALQEISSRRVLSSPLDGLLCVDAMENVDPEDWPVVLEGFAACLRPGSPAYLSVELREDDIAMDPEAATAPLVDGEVLEDGGYHYFPSPETAAELIVGHGFNVESESEGDGYHHFQLTRK